MPNGKDVEKLLFDTDILIDALRGLSSAKSYLEGLVNADVYFSVVTVTELWAGARPSEEQALEVFLSGFHPVSIDEKIARQAGVYMQHFSKSHGLLVPDALIAATAQSLKTTLVTRNTKHFPMKDVRLKSPY